MTAVEWLLNQLPINVKMELGFEKIEQAKALEKEYTIQAYSHGWHDGQDVIIKQVRHINLGGDKAGEKYYNDMKGADL